LLQGFIFVVAIFYRSLCNLGKAKDSEAHQSLLDTSLDKKVADTALKRFGW
jgi:hypothetical protein